MRQHFLTVLLAGTLLARLAGPAAAAQLRVEPVLLELNEPVSAAVLSVRNEEKFDVAVQTRVFRWSQSDGQESLGPTTDIAASPPIVRLQPGADYTIRVVRTSKVPLAGEESYRVIVDEIPDGQRPQRTNVAILIRQSIPVFLRARQMAAAHVSWSLRTEDGKLAVTGTNSGDERLRIASLRLRDAAGRAVDFGDGLVGYVLGRSSMRFVMPSPPRGFGAAGPVSVSAVTNTGPLHAMASLQDQP
jgi:fimbrial chaperone protein